MIEVRIHGRRGQGVLAAAELLAIAASLAGRRSQALRGGEGQANDESVAYCRIDDHEIRTTAPVTRPDAVIVEDVGLLNQALDGLGGDGFLLVNSSRRIDDLDVLPCTLRPTRMISVPATEIARKHTGRPVPNAALAGGFAALTGIVSLDSVLTAAQQRFHGLTGRTNAAAAMATFGVVRTELARRARAGSAR